MTATVEGLSRGSANTNKSLSMGGKLDLGWNFHVLACPHCSELITAFINYHIDMSNDVHYFGSNRCSFSVNRACWGVLYDLCWTYRQFSSTL